MPTTLWRGAGFLSPPLSGDPPLLIVTVGAARCLGRGPDRQLNGVDEHLMDIPGTEGWRYGSFRTHDAGDRRTVTLVHESGFETTVELPDFVSQGEEVGDVARIVIAAWERQEAMKGVGG